MKKMQIYNKNKKTKTLNNFNEKIYNKANHF